MTAGDAARLATAVAVGVLMLIVADTGPHVVLSAAISTLASVTVWFAATVGRHAARPTPAALRPDPPSAIPDFRVTALRQALANGSDDARLAERVRRQLIAIIDDELLAHGVDRRTEPEVARAVLGADLDRFVTDPASVHSMSLRRVDDIVTRIERI